MALISCDECGKEISDKAKSCIHCGAPIVVASSQQHFDNDGNPRAPFDWEVNSDGTSIDSLSSTSAQTFLQKCGKFIWLLAIPVVLGFASAINENIGVTLFIPISIILLISCLFPIKKLGLNTRGIALGGLVISTLACAIFFQGDETSQLVPNNSDARQEVAHKSDEAEKPSNELVEEPTTVASKLSYEIISDTNLRTSKRSVDVRLQNKLSENDLKQIASEIKNSDRQKYDRTFISYYLPKMTVGSGAWATSHYNPNLEVKVLGLSFESEVVQKNKAIDPNKDVIGIWYDDRAGAGAQLLLYRKNGILYIDTNYTDGSGDTKTLKETKIGSALRIEDIQGSSFGEYWLLQGKELKIFDNQGLITTYRAG